LLIIPALVAVTLTVSVQELPPGRVPPPKLRVVSPGVAFQVPLQVLPIPAGLATCNPDPGVKLSLKLTPVKVTDAFGFVSVRLRVETPFSGMVVGEKLLPMAGGLTTRSVAVLLVVPAPPFVELMTLVVLVTTPEAVPVTLIEIVHEPLAGILPPFK